MQIKSKKVIFIAILIFIFALPGSFVFNILKISSAKQVVVNIKEKSTVDSISNTLLEKQVISNRLIFKATLYFTKKASKIRPGSYNLRENSGYLQVTKDLSKGPDLKFLSITIPEGYELKEVAKLMAIKNPKFNKEEIISLLANKSLFIGSRELGVGSRISNYLNESSNGDLQGYLFPQTYSFLPEDKPQKVINLFLKEFDKQINTVNWQANPRKFNLNQILTIASMIEREARVAKERPLISAVIYNRLKKKMKLQICATVGFALGQHKKRLSEADLKVSSPYNTYQNNGLPPGPICNPGLESIKAAINPAKVNYLYYVLTDPKKGTHTFTDNYQVFLEAKKKAGLF